MNYNKLFEKIITKFDPELTKTSDIIKLTNRIDTKLFQNDIFNTTEEMLDMKTIRKFIQNENIQRMRKLPVFISYYYKVKHNPVNDKTLKKKFEKEIELELNEISQIPIHLTGTFEAYFTLKQDQMLRQVYFQLNGDGTMKGKRDKSHKYFGSITINPGPRILTIYLKSSTSSYVNVTITLKYYAHSYNNYLIYGVYSGVTTEGSPTAGRILFNRVGAANLYSELTAVEAKKFDEDYIKKIEYSKKLLQFLAGEMDHYSINEKFIKTLKKHLDS